VRPVRVVGKQPGVFLSFDLIAHDCQFLQRENLAVVCGFSAWSELVKFSLENTLSGYAEMN
jgi:hypothetical protein